MTQTKKLAKGNLFSAIWLSCQNAAGYFLIRETGSPNEQSLPIKAQEDWH
jgi:hypothetical protein